MNKMYIIFYVLLCFLFLIASAHLTISDNEKPSNQYVECKGKYLGMVPPGQKAKLFAPGLVSVASHEHSAAVFTRDGKELYWSVFFHFWRPQIILYMYMESDGTWSSPEVAPFSGQYSDGVSSISPDGKRLFFEGRLRDVQSVYASQIEHRMWSPLS